MSFIGDLNIKDDWFNFESPMFTLVDPNDICPLAMFPDEQQIGDLTITGEDEVNNSKVCSDQSNLYITVCQPQQPPETLPQEQQQHQMPFQQASTQLHPINSPVLQQDKPENQLNSNNSLIQFQQRLHLLKALPKRRQEQLKVRLDQKPPQVPKILRKTSGKKMSGRERLLELDKQERHLREQRDRHIEQINLLERKNNKLREILEDIVVNSPEYTTQLINFLDNSDLLVEPQDSACDMAG